MKQSVIWELNGPGTSGTSWQSETLIGIARKCNFDFAKTGGNATFPNLRHICFNGGVKILTARKRKYAQHLPPPPSR